jgi:Periplasmic copper-binding protein (NosD)/Right handed beta helix region
MSTYRSVAKTGTSQRRSRRSHRPGLELLEGRALLSTVGAGDHLRKAVAQPATIVVTNVNDSGPGSLRAAIYDSNAHPGSSIVFDIPGSGVKTIALDSDLPAILRTVTIDGYTERGATINSLGPGQGTNASLAIQIRPANYRDTADGLWVLTRSTGTVITGLSIFGFRSSDVAIEGGRDTQLAGDFIGVNAHGDRPEHPGRTGVQVKGSTGNTIGGLANADRNLISGNAAQGIELSNRATKNLVVNNLIGTQKLGGGSAPNNFGIDVKDSADHNTIGGTATAARNVISGNYYDGVYVDGGVDTQIVGNYIGTDATGQNVDGNRYPGIRVFESSGLTIADNLISGNGGGGADIGANPGPVVGTVLVNNVIGLAQGGINPIPNFGFGVRVGARADQTMIGGAAPGSGNVISGNVGPGISVVGGGTTVIEQNLIGTTATGAAGGNSGAGVSISGGTVTVGGTTATAGNVIAGNAGAGVMVSGGGAMVQGNTIGLMSNRADPLPNGSDGVLLSSASGSTIGGSQPGAGNVISGNLASGVYVLNSSGIAIEGNLIGLQANGAAAAGNQQNGVGINGSTGVSLSGNVIAANGGGSSGFGGVAIVAGAGQSAAASVTGNTIGLNQSGLPAGNSGFGIQAGAGAGSVKATIGGTTPGAGNVIAGNAGDGIQLLGLGTTIQGNAIGTDSSGTRALGNGGFGVEIDASGNTVGGNTAVAGNVISANVAGGVLVQDVAAASSGLTIGHNLIGTNAAGTAALGAQALGVDVENSSGVTIGGGGAGNVISGNAGAAIVLNQGSNLAVQGNLVGTNVAGTAAVPNNTASTAQASVVAIGASNVTIGGTAPGVRNVISGNYVNGIWLAGGANLVIQGNNIGTAITGSSAVPNLGNGLVIGPAGGATSPTNVMIGGTAAGAGNLISGNAGDGVLLSGANGLSIQGNKIGTDPAGGSAVGNAANGIDAIGNVNVKVTIGGLAAGAGNLISGNAINGIALLSPNVFVFGNQIGTNQAGSAAIPNGQNGVYASLSNETIGSTAPGGGNLISGNVQSGIAVVFSGANLIAGNSIGISLNPNVPALPNAVGVTLAGPSNYLQGNTIAGNTGDGAQISSSGNTVAGGQIGIGLNNQAVPNRNGIDIVSGNNNLIGTPIGVTTISGNAAAGVLVQSGSGNAIFNAYIGTNPQGTSAVANQGGGVVVSAGATGTAVGVAVAGSGNLISGNTGAPGVSVAGTGTLIRNSIIGLALNQQAALPNGVGVLVQGSAQGTTIGGTTGGAGSFISGNAGAGVSVTGNAAGTLIQGNDIGMTAGNAAIGNGGDGIAVAGGTNTTIGSATAGPGRNVISGNAGNGVSVTGAGTTGTLIQGNYIGTDEGFTQPRPNGGAGVSVAGTSAVIGGPAGGSGPGPRNFISGNTGPGVSLTSTTSVSILNDYIGVNAAGANAIGNGGPGVLLTGATGTTIGGLTGLGNLIAANAGDGVEVTGTSQNTSILGNLIGTSGGGLAALPNVGNGVDVTGSATSTTIGGTTPGQGNVLSGNAQNGVEVAGSGASSTLVQGNLIGTGSSGETALGNTLNGVLISGASGVTVGGTGAGAGNLISANEQLGVQAVGGTGTLVQGNLIGTDKSGLIALGNSVAGVQLSATNQATVGGTTAGAGNVISGNGTLGSSTGGDGIQVSNAASTLIAGNLIGTGATGSTIVANTGNGINIAGTSAGTTIGQLGFGNVISGNGGDGILFGQSATVVTVVDNLIGVTESGTGAAANAIGVQLKGTIATIGTPSADPGQPISGQGNVISGNLDAGIEVDGTASGVIIQSNMVGTGATGTSAVGNGTDGILVDGADGVTIGGSSDGQGNVISGNDANGIDLQSARTALIQGNQIGTDPSTAIPVPNGADGVLFQSSSQSVIQGNTIAGNTSNGVELNTNSDDNQIFANDIGTENDGTTVVGNGGYGVFVQNNSQGNTIGGTPAGRGNVIAGNQKGVVIGNNRVTDNSVENAILGNSIFANTQIGIDLGNAGVFPATDPPLQGPNLLQNDPVLETATASGSSLTVGGTLSSVPSQTYRVEFFVQDASNPSTEAQGETFIGYASVTTDSTGNANWTTTLTGVIVQPGQVLTATATDPNGNTSEFSESLTVG